MGVLVGLLSALGPLGVFAGFAGLAVALSKSQHRTIDRVFAEAGAHLDADVTKASMLAGPKLQVMTEGCAAHVSYFRNKNAQHTTFTIRYPNLGLGLHLKTQGQLRTELSVVPLVGTILRSVSQPDIEVGDPLFDRTFLVYGNHPEAIRAFLTDERRLTLGRLQSHYPKATITDMSITWKSHGMPTPELIDSTVRRFVAVAQILHGGNQPINRALETLSDGDFEAGIEQLDKVSGPTAPEAQLLAALANGMAGDVDKANERLYVLENRLPSDTELQAMRVRFEAMHDDAPSAPATIDTPLVFDDPHDDHLAERPPPPHSPATPERPPPPHSSGSPKQPPPPPAAAETPPAVDLTAVEQSPTPAPPPADPQTALLDALFRDGPTRALANFRRTCQDLEVHWQGPVRRVTPYTYDLDFPGSGVKVLVGIGRIEAKGLGAREIDAVVQLPSDTPVGVGDTIEFSGTLVKLDGLSKNLFVADATLLTRLTEPS